VLIDLGLWQVASNVPDISGTAHQRGSFYTASTVDPLVPEVVPPGVLGIEGTTIADGTKVYWNSTALVWQGKPVGTLPYVSVTGDTMTGRLNFSGATGITANAVNNRVVQVDSAWMQSSKGAGQEGYLEFWTDNGGYSSGMGFETMISSPAGIYVSGTSSATTHSNRSESSLKEDINELDAVEVATAFASLHPVSFKWKNPEGVPVDADGIPKPDPWAWPVQLDHWGFLADEIDATPSLKCLIHTDYKSQERGWDIGQVLALTVARVQQLEAQLAQSRR
jgi:hypothetical protein